MPQLVLAQEVEELLGRISKMEPDTAMVRAYEEAFELFLDHDYRQAGESLKRMEQLSKGLGYERGFYRAQLLKAKLFYYTGGHDSSLYYARIYLKGGPSEKLAERARVHNILGLAFQQKQVYDSAAYYFKLSMEGMERAGQSEDICAVFNNLGLTVYFMGNAERSIEYFEDAYRCMLREKQTEHLGEVINNIASLSAQLKRDNADSMFLDVLHKPELIPDENTRATLLLNLGSYYNLTGELHKAERFLLQSDSLFKVLGVAAPPEIKHTRGLVTMKSGDLQKGISYLNSVRRDVPVYQQMDMLYRDIADAYFATGQVDSGQYFYKALVARKDSVAEARVEEVLAGAQRSVDFIKKDSEIRELSLQNDLLDAEQGRSRLIITSLAMLLGLLMLTGWLYARKQAEKRKVEQLELARKNQSLLELSRQITSKNRIIDDIEARLREDNASAQLQQNLKANVVQAFNLQGDWDTFNRYFEDQHKGFYSRLKEHSSELTDNDLRICSLSRLRLSLKESANILNVSVDAVKSSRYRIRKKLKLSSDQSLSDFLNDL